MPRPKKEGAPEPKRRSRHGCWPCKTRKIKCGEEKPNCQNCERQGEKCDYSIRLNWEGRGKKSGDDSIIKWSPELSTPGSTHARSPNNNHNHNHNTPPATSHSSAFMSPRSQIPQHTTLALPPPAAAPAAPVPSSSQHSTAFQQPPTFPTYIDPRLNPVSQGQGTKRKRFSPDTPESPEHRFDYPPWQGSSARSLPPPPAATSQPAVSPRAGFTPVPMGPLTPASEDSQPKTGPDPRQHQQQQQQQHQQQQQQQQIPLDRRRLSVQYLLHSPPDSEPLSFDYLSYEDQQPSKTVYGYDQGLPDEDLPDNDDANGLVVQSPETVTRRLSVIADLSESDAGRQSEFGFGLCGKNTRFDREDYYARPIPVRIPRHLEPLPAKLLENPMNLLYFHHFLNHTARILVPHDCPENPFRNHLPQMAAQNENLLSLLLAYAASHRARLLNHADPSNRIALYVRDVFSNLSNALKTNDISDANLATAIMLASLEIISPNVFEVPVSWQKHLTIARQMIIARGGFQALQQRGKGPYFLGRWFAYLDVLGSLSGNNYDRPLEYSYFSETDDPDDDSEIDCLLGFTNRCVTTLARVADLARQCDGQRIGLGGVVDENWRPSPDIVEAAEKLKTSLQAARPTAFRACVHRKPDATDDAIAESWEMIAINDTYHWAGLIHLYRRVLGRRAADEEVQISVREIVSAMDRVRVGGTAETCMIFPIFTAGCEALDPVQQDKIMTRLKHTEGYGMTQVQQARDLIREVWNTGKPWVTLVSGEFFG